uniref:Uncharacterized protein n=1 Tax=Rousettus aegyptiacus TaxID=9407 RepID=A0A7J8GBV4_ROUAE|nr:hypothetical protein HJG63_011693 [Rousettus aegyptiacus]
MRGDPIVAKNPVTLRHVKVQCVEGHGRNPRTNRREIMSCLPGKQPQSDQAGPLTREDTCSAITQHLSALPLPGAISRVLGLGEEKGGAPVEKPRETQWAPPPARLQLQIFTTRGLPSSITAPE